MYPSNINISVFCPSIISNTDDTYFSISGSPQALPNKFNVPTLKPPNNQGGSKAEELLKMLVNPIDFDLTEDYLHPENFPESGPFFDLHRTKNVTALKGVTTNLVCRVRRLGNHTVIMQQNT